MGLWVAKCHKPASCLVAGGTSTNGLDFDWTASKARRAGTTLQVYNQSGVRFRTPLTPGNYLPKLLPEQIFLDRIFVCYAYNL